MYRLSAARARSPEERRTAAWHTILVAPFNRGDQVNIAGVIAEASSRFFHKFYSVSKYDATVAFFPLDGSWLGLYGRSALAEDATVSPEGTGFEGFALAHNVSSEEEVDRIMNQAVAAGATQVKPPQQVFWGGYSGYFKDPDGHLWEVAYNPHFWIGPRDEDA